MCLKWAFCMKHCVALTPSFKVRILLAEQAKPANAKVLHKVQVLITSKASNKVLGHLFKIFDFGNG